MKQSLPLLLLFLICCSLINGQSTVLAKEPQMNPVSYFEIPVTDMERAVHFYQSVFDYELQETTIDGIQMALFPQNESAPGASGALAKGESYQPSKSGPRIYFTVPDIESVLTKVRESGGEVAYPKTSIGDLGWVAEFIDSEGNQIALHSL